MELLIEIGGTVPSFFGRTLYDPELRGMFFNWTATGFSFAVQGGKAEVELTAMADNYPGEAENLPWLAVFVDESPQPSMLLRLKEGKHHYTVWEGSPAARHTLRIVKRSENSKGRCCVHRLWTDGTLSPFTPAPKSHHIEFVGDSITCGFGNEMAADEPTFNTQFEDGLGTYAAEAARLLDADMQCICISGIPLCWASDPSFRMKLPFAPDFVPPVRAMEDHYRYTDRNHQEAMGMADGFEPWDFERFTPDAIVINLGTNDAFRIRVSGNDPAEEAHFGKRYITFLEQVRRLNGEGPVLACTLGSMDYFMYSTIENAVREYQQKTGDTRIFCMKFGAIDPWGEGIGGLAHPNTKTQKRMGRELAAALGPWLGSQGE